MFERYNEPARRTLFFSRYEASELGSVSIGTEHLLLGLIRESDELASRGILAQLLATSNISPADLRRETLSRTSLREKVSTSIEIPFNADTKRVLQSAAEEADRLMHDHIGSEHLFLGLLREELSVAGAILVGRGLRLHDVRNLVVKLLAENPVSASTSGPVDFARQLDHIKDLVAQLAALSSGGSETQTLAARIRDRVDELKRQIVE